MCLFDGPFWRASTIFSHQTKDKEARNLPSHKSIISRIDQRRLWLHLWGTKVADLEPIKGLTEMQSLDLSDTQVADLEPIRGFTALKTIFVEKGRVESLEKSLGRKGIVTVPPWLKEK